MSTYSFVSSILASLIASAILAGLTLAWRRWRNRTAETLKPAAAGRLETRQRHSDAREWLGIVAGLLLMILSGVAGFAVIVPAGLAVNALLPSSSMPLRFAFVAVFCTVWAAAAFTARRLEYSNDWVKEAVDVHLYGSTLWAVVMSLLTLVSVAKEL